MIKIEDTIQGESSKWKFLGINLISDKGPMKSGRSTLPQQNATFCKIFFLVGGFSYIERWYLKNLDLVSKNKIFISIKY